MNDARARSWAVTMYSFTGPVRMAADPAEVLRFAAGSGIASRFEIDAAQYFPSFPRVARGETDALRRLAADTGIQLALLGAYVETGSGEPPRVGDGVDALRAQLEAAAHAGFEGVRIPLGSLPAVEGAVLVTELERAGTRCLFELQGSIGVDDPRLAEILPVVRANRDRLGLVLDASMFMIGLPTSWCQYLEEQFGVGAASTRQIDEALRTGLDGTDRARLLDDLSSGDALLRERLAAAFLRFGYSEPDDWRWLFDDVDVMHLKFWDDDDSAGALSTPLTKLARAADQVGWSGGLVSEWGGHEWVPHDASTVFALTTTHHRIASQAFGLAEPAPGQEQFEGVHR